MAGSIDRVCTTLVAVGNAAFVTGDAGDLRDVCRRMVQTANQVNGSGATANSYGIGASALGNALQQINADELNAPREQLAETQRLQTASVASRLAALRSGLSGGGGARVAGGLYDLTPLGGLVAGGASGAGMASGSGMASGADSIASNWGAFVSGFGNWGNRDATANAEGFDFNSGGGVLGVDYRLRESWIVGGALGYSQYDADFDASANSAAGQNLESDSYSLTLYTTYYASERWYFDGIFNYAAQDYDGTRRVVITSLTGVPGENRTIRSDFEADQWSLTVGGGYQIPYGARSA